MNLFENKQFTFHDFIFFFVFMLASLRATVFFPLFPETTFNPFGNAWIEITLWLTILGFAVFDLFRNKQAAPYLDLLLTNKILILFVLFCGSSIFWSVSFDFSLFRWLELVCATLLASYFATQYKSTRFFELLFWMGIALVTVNVYIGLFKPVMGISSGHPYYGAWNGIFWHKNHFGILMFFFNILNLFFMFYYYPTNKRQLSFSVLFYFATLILIFLSKSVTAIFGTLILNTTFLLLQFWLRIRRKLTINHYFFGGGAALIGLFLVYLNLDFFLRLFGKDRTLTGRSDLWIYLLDKFVTKQPWLGYGFGAFWSVQEFRVKITQKVAWGSQVLTADNGFIDILVHIGIIGLSIFGLILVMAFIRSIRNIIYDSSNIFSFFPLFFVIYAVLVNISFSLFMETEVFIWIMVVYVLAQTQSTLKE